jgi:hypothetical protein
VNDFEYGIVPRAIFIGLCWITVLLGFTEPNWLPWHIALLLFLGLGLKPLLLKTGLYHGWLRFLVKVDEARHLESDAANRARVERKRRDTRLRKARRTSSDLPPGW